MPELWGVLNVTPDSFSDGGKYLEPRAAIEHGRRMLQEGADLLRGGHWIGHGRGVHPVGPIPGNEPPDQSADEESGKYK